MTWNLFWVLWSCAGMAMCLWSDASLGSALGGFAFGVWLAIWFVEDVLGLLGGG